MPTQTVSQSESNTSDLKKTSPKLIPQGFSEKLLMAVAIGLSVFQIYTAIFGMAEMQRVIHLVFILVILFLMYRGIGKPGEKSGVPTVDWICIALVVICFGYLIWNKDYILERIDYVTPVTRFELFAGIAGILLLLEGTRRVIGPSLPLLAVIFLIYAIFGHKIPGQLGHRGYSIDIIVEHTFLLREGIFGIPLAVASTYIFMFILFGTFLEKTGVSNFFLDLAMSLTGWTRGGPAKSAVVASAMMGTISGSAVANVATTGSFTIPLMKRTGYRSEFAGAVEAVASTGGQIMPPIMGAAAFVMAEFTGVGYLKILYHALLPALLYFLAVWFMVHFEACRTGLKGLPRKELPPLMPLLITRGYQILPVIVIVVVLFIGYSALMAALSGVVSVVLVGLVKQATRMKPGELMAVMDAGARRCVIVSAACACAGIAIGMITLTGIGMKLTSLIIFLSQGKLLIALLLTALCGMILGMGLPTTPTYIIMAALLAPAMVKLGVHLIAAHFFIFYYGIIAVITPPVALASYTAAGIADGKIMTTALIAVKLGITAYIVPLMFAYSQELLLIGSPIKILLSLFTSVTGVFFLSAGIQGWLLGPIRSVERFILIPFALVLIWPEWITDSIGLVVCSAILIRQYIFNRKINSQNLTSEI